jgi:4-amino-4-deoxy-L-arabinose transferase-like glycosyltransferase
MKHRSGHWKLVIGNWLFVALLLVGAFLFVFRITHESVWMDEAFSIALADNSFADIWRLSVDDSHPPLYHFMLRAFRLVFGDSIFVARLFSALGAFCLVLLGAGPLRRACGDKVGLIYAMMAVVSPTLISYGQEARMYVWAAVFVTGTAMYTYLAITGGKRSDWVRAGVFTFAAVYTHTYSLLAAFFVGLFALVWLFLKDRKKLPAFLVAMGVPALSFIPWLLVLLRQSSRVSQDFWIPEVTGESIVHALICPYSLKFYFDHWSFRVNTVIAFSVIIAGMVIAFSRQRRNRMLPVLCLFAFLATFFTAVLLSLLIRPILIPRYMVPLLGLFLVAVAYGISQLNRWLVVIACVVLVGLQLGAIPSIYFERFNGPMDEVVAYLEENMGEDDIFVHIDEHTVHTFAFYLPDRLHVVYLPPGAKVYANLEVHGDRVKIISDLSEMPRDRTVWFAARVDGLNTQLYGEILPALGIEFGPMTLDEAIDAGRLKVFSIPESWYVVALERIEPRP